MELNGIFRSPEIFQWKVIFITLMKILHAQPTLSHCIHCQTHSRQYWNTNNPTWFRSFTASIFHDIVVLQATSRIPKKGEEMLKLPFSFMGKTKSSLAKDFTVPWVCIFPKNPITKRDFAGGEGKCSSISGNRISCHRNNFQNPNLGYTLVTVHYRNLGFLNYNILLCTHTQNYKHKIVPGFNILLLCLFMKNTLIT